ncbi:DinB family protein [Actinoplanes sp. HUAS TT8]|uniref:DinB family protein n=1 Tax=Actinoplanes sp. HUAS TT8 TaxID=3447453 RepID=UPI003F5264F3
MADSLVDSGDVHSVVEQAVAALRSVGEQDWQVPAGGLDWSCWETVEHVADDLFAYAGQLAADRPPTDEYVPWGYRRSRPGAPALTVHVDPEHGTAGLLRALEAAGGLLAAVVRVSPADRRGYHPFGVSDASGFAAMGIVEVVAHLHDVAGTLKFPWSPDPDVCARVLGRLFPDAPAGHEPWPTLLWATGRAELPGHPRQEKWRWYA